MNRIDWTDFQFVVCVARTHSLSAAARELGVNHSTVLRRVSAFEQAVKVQLFTRDSKGYRLSPHGKTLLQDIGNFETAMKGLALRFSDYDAQLEGNLCVTTTPGFFRSILKNSIFQFARLFPGIKLDLQLSYEIKNLAHLESDVAIRPSESIPDGFFGEKIGTVKFFIYAQNDLSKNLQSKDIFKENCWIGFSGTAASSGPGQFLAKKVSKEQCILLVNSFEGALDAVSAGLGIGLLPEHLLQEAHTSIKALSLDPIIQRPIYVIARKELQTSRRVNAFINYMVKNANIDQT